MVVRRNVGPLLNGAHCVPSGLLIDDPVMLWTNLVGHVLGPFPVRLTMLVLDVMVVVIPMLTLVNMPGGTTRVIGVNWGLYMLLWALLLRVVSTVAPSSRDGGHTGMEKEGIRGKDCFLVPCVTLC